MKLINEGAQRGGNSASTTLKKNRKAAIFFFFCALITIVNSTFPSSWTKVSKTFETNMIKPINRIITFV